MWRRWWSSGGPLKQTVAAIYNPNPMGLRSIIGNGSPAVSAISISFRRRAFSDSAAAGVGLGVEEKGEGKLGGGGAGINNNNNNNSNSNSNNSTISFAEAKKLMRLVNVEALKRKLGMEGKEVIEYSELLQACESIGVARSNDEAAAFAQVLDEAGVVLLFRDKVYLHPDKVGFSIYLYIYE